MCEEERERTDSQSDYDLKCSQPQIQIQSFSSPLHMLKVLSILIQTTLNSSWTLF